MDPVILDTSGDWIGNPMSLSARSVSNANSLSSMSIDSMIDKLQKNALSNSRMSQEFAREQMEWQQAQNAKAMEFNSKEAEINREWQKMMSDTAHQREMADLIAAGLNPVLTATGGNGASVGSGATASGVTSAGSKGEVDTSLNSSMITLLSSLISSSTQLMNAATSAKSAETVAQMYTDMERYTSQLSTGATKYAANASAAATRYASDNNYAAAQYSADSSKSASTLGSILRTVTSVLGLGLGAYGLSKGANWRVPSSW